MTYKLINCEMCQVQQVKRSDGAIILFDSANTDYIAYLLWLEAGNVPEKANE